MQEQLPGEGQAGPLDLPADRAAQHLLKPHLKCSSRQPAVLEHVFQGNRESGIVPDELQCSGQSRVVGGHQTGGPGRW